MSDPTGDALAAHERVVEAVEEAISEACGWALPPHLSRACARAAIEAYQKAMREGE